MRVENKENKKKSGNDRALRVVNCCWCFRFSTNLETEDFILLAGGAVQSSLLTKEDATLFLFISYSYKMAYIYIYILVIKRKPAVAGTVIMRTCRGHSWVIMSNKSTGVNDTMPLF